MHHKKIWDKIYNNPFQIPFTSGIKRFAGEDPNEKNLPATSFKSPYLGVRAFVTIIYYCLQKGNDPRRYVIDYLPECEFKNLLLSRSLKDFTKGTFEVANLETWFYYFIWCLGSQFDYADMMFIRSLGYTFMYNENYVSCTEK